MKKGINLQAKMHVGNGAGAVQAMSQALPAAFAQSNPGLQLTVKGTPAVDASGNATIRVYIEGDQDPAADFAALTRSALNKAIASINTGATSAPATAPASPAPGGASGGAGKHNAVRVHDIREVDDTADEGDLVLPPQRQQTQTKAGATSPSGPSAEPTTPPASQTPAFPSPTPSVPAPALPARAPWWAIWKRDKK